MSGVIYFGLELPKLEFGDELRIRFKNGSEALIFKNLNGTYELPNGRQAYKGEIIKSNKDSSGKFIPQIEIVKIKKFIIKKTKDYERFLNS